MRQVKPFDLLLVFAQLALNFGPRDLAHRLIEILQAPELERHMAQQNFATGVEMSMSTVINNYLRWFRLNKAKLALSREWMIVDQKWLGAQTDTQDATGFRVEP